MKRLADPRIRILKGTPIQPENTTSSSTSMPDPRPIFSADTGHLWCFRAEKGMKDLPFIENEWLGGPFEQFLIFWLFVQNNNTDCYYGFEN